LIILWRSVLFKTAEKAASSSFWTEDLRQVVEQMPVMHKVSLVGGRRTETFVRFVDEKLTNAKAPMNS
jgi:hypothetical protein